MKNLKEKIKSIAFYSATVPMIDYNKQSAGSLLLKVVTWVLTFAGALGALAIIYAGLQYATAGANPDRQQKAKKALTNAIIGIIVVLISFVVVFFVRNAIDQAVNFNVAK